MAWSACCWVKHQPSLVWMSCLLVFPVGEGECSAQGSVITRLAHVSSRHMLSTGAAAGGLLEVLIPPHVAVTDSGMMGYSIRFSGRQGAADFRYVGFRAKQQEEKQESRGIPGTTSSVGLWALRIVVWTPAKSSCTPESCLLC